MVDVLIGDMRHNHNKKLAALMSANLLPVQQGTAFAADVKHDPVCPVLREPPGICDCDCEIWIDAVRYDDLLLRGN